MLRRAACRAWLAPCSWTHRWGCRRCRQLCSRCWGRAQSLPACGAVAGPTLMRCVRPACRTALVWVGLAMLSGNLLVRLVPSFLPEAWQARRQQRTGLQVLIQAPTTRRCTPAQTTACSWWTAGPPRSSVERAPLSCPAWPACACQATVSPPVRACCRTMAASRAAHIPAYSASRRQQRPCSVVLLHARQLGAPLSAAKWFVCSLSFASPGQAPLRPDLPLQFSQAQHVHATGFLSLCSCVAAIHFASVYRHAYAQQVTAGLG